ncbi:TMEM14-domain-containing protein [Metschnikowia bicuspidata var. bicuspidata NRRL YB-4993]|uniref:TMEM14-domain-containing protein n=1 Tax=Metschnikowia bicuspidata var. bicuspidata NRRL YB-4993 TaxID=869754 RepID=A0A1A0HC75_9ASCO|nr:TMEM14-domain-containing protein [Metschnikowia bicuspidata var. bicuspidata NRRL YB-4993]OBA21595.1 TMEM14-domain-containing protein [Metschnikowia bicuspidata var. bicuspidata NRRL YB-4993]
MELTTYTLAGIYAVGGTMGYVLRGSVHSLLVGGAVSALYGYSGYLLKDNADWGLKLALGCSTSMLATGIGRVIVTRFAKPVPVVLLVLGGLSSTYYFGKYNEFQGLP